MTQRFQGRYGSDHDPVEYILGITHQIWEERGVARIRDYYANDVVVYALGGIVRGADAVVEGTERYLEAFPDRQLLGDDVVWTGTPERFYSSHRIRSPMTNLGASRFGPATKCAVWTTAIADCYVDEGQVTHEWLIRDDLSLVSQLALDPLKAAATVAAERSKETLDWLASERARVLKNAAAPEGPGWNVGELEQPAPSSSPSQWSHAEAAGFAERALQAVWSGSRTALGDTYAPYAVLNRSPVERYSGLEAVAEHYASLASAFGEPRISLDHVIVQPNGATGANLAARWTLAGASASAYLGAGGAREPVLVLGISQWQIIAGRIVRDWTVFDGLAVLAQLV